MLGEKRREIHHPVRAIASHERLHERPARGRSSALAGWPAFDGPSSAAGLSDRRICAGGLAGFLTGWAGRTFRGSPAAQLISRCGAN